MSDLVTGDEGYYNGYKEGKAAGRAEVIEEFVDWLGKELATIHLLPEQRAKLYADILIKGKELMEQK